MLTYTMSVSADGYIADRDGAIDFTAPSAEQFRFSLEQVRGLGAYLLGRRLYESMLVWETDESLRETEDFAAFADTWSALPKVVFSRTLERAQGNARIATGTLEGEVAAALGGTTKNIAIGGATIAAAAIELDLVDEFKIIRAPYATGGGVPFWPPMHRAIPLQLVETKVFGTRNVYERYRRVSGSEMTHARGGA